MFFTLLNPTFAKERGMKKISITLLFVCISLFGLSTPAYPAVSVVLNIDGIPGESVINGHEDKIDVLNWEWQMSAPHTVAGGGTWKAIVRPVIVTKYVDLASPHIALALFNKPSIATATLTVMKAGIDAVEFLRIKMWNVQILNQSTANSQGDDTVLESVALGFDRVCYEYTPQNEDGSPEATIEKCWDIAANQEFQP